MPDPREMPGFTGALRQVYDRSIASFESNLQLACDCLEHQKKCRSFLGADFCIIQPSTSEKMSQHFKTLKRCDNR